MRVLLAYPACLEARAFEENVAAPPMGLYWVAAKLVQEGHEVAVFNAAGLDKDAGPHGMTGRFEQAIQEFRPRVAAFSILQANRFHGLELAEKARELDPDLLTVFGGPTPTFLWELLLRHYPQVDCIVAGEGEQTMAALCAAVDSGRDWTGLPGIAFRDARGEPVRNDPPEPIADLDSLPIPAEHYTYQHLSLTRGCPGTCTFCGSPRFWGPKVRSRSAKHFVDEMELLARRGQRFLFVSDDTFTFRREVCLEVCDEIVRRGLDITWQAISRVDFVDLELLKAMRRAGCIQVSYGVESGSEAMRRVLNKKTSQDRIEQAFALTRRAGLLPRAYFIYGIPGETEADVQASLDLLGRIKPLVALFHVLVAFPGTALWDRAKKRTGLTDAYWLDEVEDLMWFEVDPDISSEDMLARRELLHTAFARGLPDYARSVVAELDPGSDGDPAMARLHADFLSRLGMTFYQGEHAELVGDQGPDLARELFQAAQGFGGDARSLLGLGMLAGRERDFDRAVELLGQGVEAHPEHANLRLGLATALAATGRHEEALETLAPLGDHPEARELADHCRRASG